MSHQANLALIRSRMGEEWLTTATMTIVLTIRTVAPDQLDDGYRKVIQFLADQLRQEH